MSMQINPDLRDFNTSDKQIELIESIGYIQGPQLTIDQLLQLRSVNAFVKRCFENHNHQYTQVLSVSNNLVTCKVFVDNEQVSECTEATFNKARVKAAILAMQEFDLELLRLWLADHKSDLQNYLNV